jgi:hypothetical protein
MGGFKRLLTTNKQTTTTAGAPQAGAPTTGRTASADTGNDSKTGLFNFDGIPHMLVSLFGREIPRAGTRLGTVLHALSKAYAREVRCENLQDAYECAGRMGGKGWAGTDKSTYQVRCSTCKANWSWTTSKLPGIENQSMAWHLMRAMCQTEGDELAFEMLQQAGRLCGSGETTCDDIIHLWEEVRNDWLGDGDEVMVTVESKTPKAAQTKMTSKANKTAKGKAKMVNVMKGSPVVDPECTTPTESSSELPRDELISVPKAIWEDLNNQLKTLRERIVVLESNIESVDMTPKAESTEKPEAECQQLVKEKKSAQASFAEIVKRNRERAAVRQIERKKEVMAKLQEQAAGDISDERREAMAEIYSKMSAPKRKLREDTTLLHVTGIRMMAFGELRRMFAGIGIRVKKVPYMTFIDGVLWVMVYRNERDNFKRLIELGSHCKVHTGIRHTTIPPTRNNLRAGEEAKKQMLNQISRMIKFTLGSVRMAAAKAKDEAIDHWRKWEAEAKAAQAPEPNLITTDGGFQKAKGKKKKSKKTPANTASQGGGGGNVSGGSSGGEKNQEGSPGSLNTAVTTSQVSTSTEEGTSKSGAVAETETGGEQMCGVAVTIGGVLVAGEDIGEGCGVAGTGRRTECGNPLVPVPTRSVTRDERESEGEEDVELRPQAKSRRLTATSGCR